MSEVIWSDSCKISRFHLVLQIFLQAKTYIFQ